MGMSSASRKTPLIHTIPVLTIVGTETDLERIAIIIMDITLAMTKHGISIKDQAWNIDQRSVHGKSMPNGLC